MISSIVIIGAGLAGLTAARTLRSEGYEGQINFIGDELFKAYDRPSLSKAVLLGKEEFPPSLVDDSWYETAQIDLHLGEPVSEIDPKNRVVTLGEGAVSIPYDRLLIASGSRARYAAIEGGGLEGVFYLRDGADSVALRQVMTPEKSLVIVGGGLIGCEVATTACSLGLDVTILEAADELLLRVLGRETGAWCRSQLEGIGVKVKLNAHVSCFEGKQSIRGVVCADGSNLMCDLVLVSVGAVPADALARDAGLDCERGIKVDAEGKTSCTDIFAAGDVALWPSENGGRRSFQTYINSQKQAEIAARAMLNIPSGSPSSAQISSSWTEIAGHRLQMLGDIDGPGELVVRGDWRDESLILFRHYDDQIEAVIAINLPKDFSVASRFLTSKVPVFVDQLQDAAINLRVLLKNNITN